MSFSWLANADPVTAWANLSSADLAARTDKDHTVVVLPVHGFADHGLGLPLDAEEIVGSAVLRAAVENATYPNSNDNANHSESATHSTGSSPAPVSILVLPPLRLTLAPYANTFFGVGPETALETLMEIAGSVKASGFTRLAFLNTSPWNAELITTAALDVRVAHGLNTYVISLARLDLGFHPGGKNREYAQAVAAHLLSRPPATDKARPTDVRDADFRPGYFVQPAGVKFNPSLDGAELLAKAAGTLATLLAEISVHRTAKPVPILNTRTTAATSVNTSETAAATAKTPSATAAAAVSSDITGNAAVRARYLGGMTRAEIDRIKKKDRALVIIPTGAIEQHGQHLPLGTDALLGQGWLAHALPKVSPKNSVYVAPALTYGKSNEHTGFAGTITLSASLFRRQLLALITQLRALGFAQFALLNTHGGNSAVLVPTVRELQTKIGMRVGMLSNYYKPTQSPQEATFGFHAGEWETALMLALTPDLVRMDRAVCEYPAQLNDAALLRPEGAAGSFGWITADVSRSGVIGDATLATAEKGKRWLEEGSTALASKIDALLKLA